MKAAQNLCSECRIPPNKSHVLSGTVLFFDRYCPKCNKSTSGVTLEDSVRRWNELNPAAQHQHTARQGLTARPAEAEIKQGQQ